MPACLAAILPTHAVVAAKGPDARGFLQGQLTNDLHALDRHPGLLSAACNPQGRVLATMRLAADGEDVLLVLRRQLAPVLAKRLAAHVLRARLRIEERGEGLAVAGVMDAPPGAYGSPAAARASGLSLLVASPRRTLLVGPGESVTRAIANLPRVSADEWERVSIEDGEPAIHPETSALWTPQMLNLDLQGGVSFAKGCYVGQEIVARSQNLGRIKRRMLRYQGPRGAVLKPAQALFSGESLAGQVVTAVEDEAASQCLAVVDLRYCSDLLGATPGSSDFVPADLPYTIPAPGSGDRKGDASL